MIYKIVITEDNGDKRNVGEYNEETNTFITYREGKKHLLRKYNAWAIDKKVLNMLLEKENPLIEIIDTKSKEKYIVLSEDFNKYGKEIQFHQHRKQVYLEKDKFKVIKGE